MTDVAIFKFINYELSNGFFDTIMPIISNKWVWVPVYLCFVIIAIVKFKKQAWRPILAILLCYLATELAANTIKNTLKRTRPCNIESLYAVKRVSGGSGYSTPSAHAANHLAIALVVGAVLGLGAGYKTLLLFWAFIIGFSRIYNGVHFPSDVLLGWALGAAIALIFIVVYQKFLLVQSNQE